MLRTTMQELSIIEFFSKKFSKMILESWGEHLLLLKSPQWVRFFRDNFINFGPKLGGDIEL